MPTNKCKLKRFWIPPDETIDVSDGGFLPDPKTRSTWSFHSPPVPFEAIEHIPCLILLGEPGMGKSTWFEQKKDSLEWP